jgi:hypothetical protein
MKTISIRALALGLICLSLSLVMNGCATIPAEAPVLSRQLGSRITAMEKSHLTLLHRFFEQKRDLVDQFLYEEWLPVFAEEFFTHPTVAHAWNTIVSEDDTAARLEFLLRVGPRLQTKINARRRELIKPLDEIEAVLEEKLRADYNQARAINNSLTSFLTSAAEVAANQSRYLERLGISDAEIGNFINQIDAAVDSLHSGVEEVGDSLAAAESYRDQLEAIKAGF